MTVRCPNCQHEMELAGARAGRFAPTCPACKDKFSLTVPADATQQPIAKKIDAQSARPQSASVVETMPPTSRPRAASSVNVTLPPQPRPQKLTRPAFAPAPQKGGLIDNVHMPAPDLTGRVGGYQVIQKLGQGGMGAVYLARQMSLDRNVALKVLAPTLASDPQFVSRFTREAYAAAQLTHHNIVAIHDIGVQEDVHYFSMEFVEGQTLADTVREAGKVDPQTAAGYVLQAARGLKFAHEHGLIHRDIKPENLMLNDQGLVKVADLGLVKRANVNETAIVGGSAQPQAAMDQTQLHVSMGTPAYMPPEQARDAGTVDHRADIYSLGCTLYDLLTGRPPFMGKTAIEVITKHQREPIVPPEMVVRNVPKSLSGILLKMVAKKPDDRFATMNDVIRVLEDFLGVASSGPFTPKEEHVAQLEAAVQRFNTSGWAVLRWQIVLGFFTACGLGVAGFAVTSHSILAAATVGFAILTIVSYQVVIGITQKTHLFRKARQLLFGSSFFDWMTWIIAAGVIVMLLWVSGWLLPWVCVSIVAVGAAIAFHMSIDLLLSKDRHEPIEQTQAMLKSMRAKGLDENSIRQFVSKFGGERWEEFFESLFGYEAKISARGLWGKGEAGRDRKRFAAWRDPIVRWIENKQTARRAACERRMLAKIEAAALRAAGIDEDAAEKRAYRSAAEVVASAKNLRHSATPSDAQKRVAVTVAPGAQVTGAAPATTAGENETAAQMLVKIIHTDGSIEGPHRKVLNYTSDNFERERTSWFYRRFGTPLDLLFGNQIRLILAIVFLCAFGVWWHQNRGEQTLSQVANVANVRRTIDVGSADIRGVTDPIADAAKNTFSRANAAMNDPAARDIALPWLPARITHLLSGWGAGIAGAILLLSIFFNGKLMGFFVMFAAAIALLGYRFDLPVLGMAAPMWIAELFAAALAMFSILFFRRPDGI